MKSLHSIKKEKNQRKDIFVCGSECIEGHTGTFHFNETNNLLPIIYMGFHSPTEATVLRETNPIITVNGRRFRLSSVTFEPGWANNEMMVRADFTSV